METDCRDAAGAAATTHGVRQGYGHRRYTELIGCPISLVRTFSLTRDQLMLDRSGRLQVSGDLGHRRLYISNAYLGGMTERVPQHCHPEYLRDLTLEAVVTLRASSGAALQSLPNLDHVNEAGSRGYAPHSGAR